MKPAKEKPSKQETEQAVADEQLRREMQKINKKD